MALIDEIQKIAAEKKAEVTEKKGIYTLRFVVAERKAFLSKKTLEYTAKFRIDDEPKLIKFTEMLKESGMGLSGSSGFGFKTETHNTFNKGGQREGTIKEQSNLFGKQYSYEFNYEEIRNKIKELAESAGYEFKYQITPIGL